MGSACRIITPPGSDAAAAAARREIERLEARWSRFLPTSEISWLNRSPGRPSLVSECTVDLLRRASFAHEHTDGLFDPFLLDELEQLGYRHSMCPGTNRSSLDVTQAPVRLVQLPTDRQLDPGGIGKGYAADRVAQWLVARGTSPAIVSLGGDIRIAGSTSRPVQVEIQDPWQPDRVLGSMSLDRGGVATSSVLRRRWRGSDGIERHHLLDPRTRMPAATDVVAVTVSAGETWWAEALAKAAVIGGTTDGVPLLERHGVAAVVVLGDGNTVTIGAGEQEIAA